MTLRTAFLKGVVSHTMLGLWLKEKEIDVKRILDIYRIQFYCEALALILGVVIVYFFGAGNPTSGGILFVIEAMLLALVLIARIGGVPVVFIRDCVKLEKLLDSPVSLGLVTETGLRELADDTIWADASIVRKYEKELRLIKYDAESNSLDAFEEHRDEVTKLAKEANKTLGESYNLLARFGLVEGGYGPIFARVDAEADKAAAR